MKVSAAIKKALKAKDQGIQSGSESMINILRDLHRQVMQELSQAALGSWDHYHLRKVLDSIEYQIANTAARSASALSSLLGDAWNMGKSVVDAPLGASGLYTGYHLPTSALEALQGYGNDYLQNLYTDAWYKIKGEITLGIAGNKTPQEVASAIGNSIDSGRFKNISARAELITQTEMGRVFSTATQLRMEQAAENVSGLEKQWKHVGHPRSPRASHVAANDTHVPVNEPFIIGGVRMMYPRDPAAPLEETIGCGCDHVPYHASWHA